MSDATRAALAKLGYTDDRKVEPLGRERARAELEGLPTERLVELFLDAACECPVRVEVARTLQARELDQASREKLAQHLAREHSHAVRAELERVLGPR